MVRLSMVSQVLGKETHYNWGKLKETIANAFGVIKIN